MLTNTVSMFFRNASNHRLLLLAVAIIAWLVLGTSLIMQWSLELIPCPMCIVQRYCIIALAVFATIAVFKQRWACYPAIAFSALGAFTAARQSFLQWNPPEFMSCGRDFYGMVEAFPLSKIIPSVFAGSGDCASSADNLFGITLANASFVFFVAALTTLGVVLWKSSSKKTRLEN